MSEQKLGGDWRSKLDVALEFSGTIDLVGVGNSIRGDDGVGIEIASSLRRKLRGAGGLKVHPTAQMPERLLSKLASTAQRVILFDAVEVDRPPGTIVCRKLGESRHGFFATHNVPLNLVPGLSARLDDFYVVGVQPESLEVKEGISQTARAAAGTIVEFLVARSEARR
ncbi:MAG: hydrogenase maturation protease [Thaumarchaeota archaeon]|nr:hydrogenase maturation protease [Nitrososphaerota archaeon]